MAMTDAASVAVPQAAAPMYDSELLRAAVFAPPRKISLSPYSLTRLRPGSHGRPSLYLYEGMILPPAPTHQ